jgi:WD40 repeat protein
MTSEGYREVHLHCADGDVRIAEMQVFAPSLRPNAHCDPADIPPDTICYEVAETEMVDFAGAAGMYGLDFTPGGGGASGSAVAVLGDYLWLASNDGNLLKQWDISNPTTPVATSTLSLTAPNALAVYQGLLFVASSGGKLYIVNTDDPTAMVTELTTSLGTNNWEWVRVVGSTVFLTGRAAATIGLFDTTGNLLTQFAPAANSTALDIEGRRAFFADASGTDCNLYNYRVGGFYCAFISTGSLEADEVVTEVLRARDGEFLGDLRAWNLAVGGAADETSSGAGAFPGFLTINGTYFDSGAGDPTGVATPPDGLQVGYWFRNDGVIGALVYYTADGGATWTAIA